MDVLEVLQGVRAMLRPPQAWCKGQFVRQSPGAPRGQAYCLVGALGELAARSVVRDLVMFGRAEDMLMHCATELYDESYFSLVEFNDEHDTTHEDVLRVLDCAIERTKQDEPA